MSMGHGSQNDKMNCDFFFSEEDITQQTGGRTQRTRTKARPRSGSPTRPVSDSSTQNTSLSNPTATDEHTDKVKLQTQTESYKNTA